jgi:hypothetical protein
MPATTDSRAAPSLHTTLDNFLHAMQDRDLSLPPDPRQPSRWRSSNVSFLRRPAGALAAVSGRADRDGGAATVTSGC